MVDNETAVTISADHLQELNKFLTGLIKDRDLKDAVMIRVADTARAIAIAAYAAGEAVALGVVPPMN